MRSTQQISKKDIKFLILDDEIGIVETVGQLINQLGYYHEGYTNNQDAINALRTQQFDVLVIDFFLEHSTADELIREIRSFNVFIHIIVLTGNPTEVSREFFMEDNFINDFCEKSYDLNYLKMQIQFAINCVMQKKYVALQILPCNQKIKHLRELQGITQASLAEQIHTSRSVIAKIETSEVLPHTEILIALSKIFNVSLDFLAS